MLPNKQYFHISGLVPASKLHPLMAHLENLGAYNVEVRAFNQSGHEPKAEGTRADLTDKKQEVIEYLRKTKKPTKAAEILKAVGLPGRYSFLASMLSRKLIKKVRAGVYKV